MADDISTIYSQQYLASLNLLSQQKDSRFAMACQVETGLGKTYWHDLIGSSTAQRIVGRNGDTPNNEINHQRTKIDLAGYDDGHLLDNIDRLQTLHQVENVYVQAGNAAMNRAKDDVISAAFFASVLRGEEGGTTVTFPAANQVAVNSWAYGTGSGNTGLTISKLIEAKTLLMAGEVDPDEEMFIGVSAKQIGNMLATTEATSSDYASVKALVDGKINTFMGFTFIHSERLPTDSNSYRRVPVWQKSGMVLGVGADIAAEVSKRADKRYNWQVYHKMFLGAARVEDAKVIEIKCAE